MHSNGHSKDTSGAGATALIGESKLLDLTALFGSKSNGVASSGKVCNFNFEFNYSG
jgi:hypothetical protein